jgi:hypothetical protein
LLAGNASGPQANEERRAAGAAQHCWLGAAVPAVLPLLLLQQLFQYMVSQSRWTGGVGHSDEGGT